MANKHSKANVVCGILIAIYGIACLAALYFGVNHAMDQLFRELTPVFAPENWAPYQ